MDSINPQPQNGHIDVANLIAEKLATINISGEEYRIIWAIFRKTWGFHWKYDYISLSQFEKITLLPRSSVARAIKKLREKN